jgi:hypothetical protein
MPISFIIPIQSFKACLKLTLNAIGALEGLDQDAYEILIIQNGQFCPPPDWVLNNSKIVCVHETESSIPKARNIGFSVSQFDQVAYLDEDSICPPDWLLEVREFFKCKNVGAYQSPSRNKDRVVRFEEFYTKNNLYRGVIFFDTGASCFKREAMTDVVGFDESFKRVEDLDIAMRLVRRGWMIAFGSIVVPGEDSPRLYKKLINLYESSFHSIRLHLKHELPYKAKIFPSSFSLRAKKPHLSVILDRLFFYLLKPSPVEKCPQKRQKKYVIFFLNKGKSTLIRGNVNVMLTLDSVIFLVGRNNVFSTKDCYTYSKIFESDKFIELDMQNILDQEFLEKLSPYLWQDEKKVTL